jgi:hypothetical protein
MKQKTICIVHFNTPELTEAAILSVRKQCAENYQIVVFDNSDKRPFTKKMKGVKVINNRKQQVVNFDEELEKHPNKCWDLAHQSNYGSMKHMMSVQKLWELVPDGFILMESDLLLVDDIGFLWDEHFAATGKVQWLHSRNPHEISKDRLLPFLCYLNVPLLKAHGARYYDPDRCWCLHSTDPNDPQNRYDTGASLLEDIINTKPQLNARVYGDLHNHYAHYNGGSWRQNNEESQRAWVAQHRNLWEPYKLEQDARIYICTHKDFAPVVNHPIYEVLDARKWEKNEIDKQAGLFWSEIASMCQVAGQKDLPAMVGFCQYRKYFAFKNQVPSNLATMECVVGTRVNLGKTVREQYATFGNPDDLDLMTSIIEKSHPEFSAAWHRTLNSREFHPCSMFIMPREKFRELMKLLEMAIGHWVIAAIDIEERIKANPDAYHIDELGYDYAYRIGGQLGERIISAWIDWQFPKAIQYNIITTSAK